MCWAAVPIGNGPVVVVRAALLPKPDGGGWRPLGIGDGWFRVMGKVVAKALAEGVGADMTPPPTGGGAQARSRNWR